MKEANFSKSLMLQLSGIFVPQIRASGSFIEVIDDDNDVLLTGAAKSGGERGDKRTREGGKQSI